MKRASQLGVDRELMAKLCGLGGQLWAVRLTVTA
jgi:hypothetical protein